MSIENTMLTINRVPTLVIESGFDWITAGGFFITLAAVLASSYFTNKNFKATIESQERISTAATAVQKELSDTVLVHQEKVSDQALNAQEKRAKSEVVAGNRQEWINTLRGTVSEFISANHEMIALKHLFDAPPPGPADTTEQATEMQKIVRELIYRHVSKISEVRLSLSKVKLLLNPDELPSKNLIANMEDMLIASDQGQNLHTLEQAVISSAQVILKIEWERVKLMV